MNEDRDDLITYELPANQPVPPAAEDRAAIGELPKGVQLAQEYAEALPFHALEDPRLKWRIRPRDLDQLVRSIDIHGVINPIVVTPIIDHPDQAVGTPGMGQRYRIVSGRMRWAACYELGKTHIPAIIVDTRGHSGKEDFLRTNEQLVRRDLSPLEKGMLLRKLQAETGWPHSKTATFAGVKYATYRDLVIITYLSMRWRQYLEDNPRRLKYGRMVAGAGLEADDQNRALDYLHGHIEHFQRPPADFHLCVAVLKALRRVPDMVGRDIQSEARESIDVAMAQPVPPTANDLKGEIRKFIPDYRGDFSEEEYLRILDEEDPATPYRTKTKPTLADKIANAQEPSPFQASEDASLPDFTLLETADESLRAYVEKLLQSTNPDHQSAARTAARLYGEMRRNMLI